MDFEIQVDAEVFERLKADAEPFVDTPNSVLRRLLGLESGGGSARGAPAKTPRAQTGRSGRRKRAKTGTLLEQEAYFKPILAALNANDGRAPTREVLDEVGEALKDRLTQADRGRISSGGIRWENRAQFARLKMVDRGLLRADSPRGVWEITDAGRAYLNGTPNSAG